MMHKNKKYHFNNQVYFLHWQIKHITMSKTGKQILIYQHLNYCIIHKFFRCTTNLFFEETEKVLWVLEA